MSQCNHGWPSIHDYNSLAAKLFAQHCFDEPLQFIEQTADNDYLSSVCLARQVPTRLNNWHDLFNNISWLAYPRLKRALYQCFLQEGIGHKRRTPKQNLLAQFDECGAILATSDQRIFDCLVNHEWPQLFWCERPRLHHAAFMIIGHGLLEKSLQPFKAITAKTWLLKVDQSFFTLNHHARLRYIDQRLAWEIRHSDHWSTNRLQPLPISAWPGWWSSQHIDFYQDPRVFRPKRI